MAGYIAGKFRTGEYFKQKGVINVDQLQQTILAHKAAQESGNPKRFGEVMIELGLVTEEDLKAILI